MPKDTHSTLAVDAELMGRQTLVHLIPPGPTEPSGLLARRSARATYAGVTYEVESQERRSCSKKAKETAIPSLQDAALTRLDALIEKGNQVLQTSRPNPPNHIGPTRVDGSLYNEWRSQSLTLIADLLGQDHTYFRSFQEQVGSHSYTQHARAGVGIVRALREDVANGYLVSVSNLVSAEIFTDFLEMARHLLENGYKDPAASLGGAVLEDGLRRLASNYGLKIRDREDISSLNSKCAQKSIYTRLTQKKIQVWTEVRNHADHGQFTNYTASDVRTMLEGVASFLESALKAS